MRKCPICDSTISGNECVGSLDPTLDHRQHIRRCHDKKLLERIDFLADTLRETIAELERVWNGIGQLRPNTYVVEGRRALGCSEWMPPESKDGYDGQ